MSKGTALSKLYSKLGKEIEKAPIKQATPEEWTNYLRNRGVKQEELQNWQKAMEGIDGKISKQDALEQFKLKGDVPLQQSRSYDRRISLRELDDLKMRQGYDDNLFEPKYGSEYSLAGAPEHAYEELVLHSPWAEKLAADPAHYTDVPGGDQNLAWLRYHTRQLMNDQLPDKAALIPDSPEFVPAKLFHLDELQSNRHQLGQRAGYADLEFEKDLLRRLQQKDPSIKRLRSESVGSLTNKSIPRDLVDEFDKYFNGNNLSGLAPDAPFKGDNWKNLGLRRALIEAAQNDADLFSWTPGSMQKARWQGVENEGTSRMYDKYIPGQLMKDLKEHGATPESFLQIPDPAKSYDTRELPPYLAALISSEDDPPFLGHVSELVDSYANNPSMMRRQLYNLGLPPDRIDSAMDELGNFHQHYMSIVDRAADPVDEMEAMTDFGQNFVPQYLKNLSGLQTAKIPAVRLTPEIRKSILEKGFPKYIAPLGAIGASMQQEEEPQGYAAGGVVKKAGASALKELLENLHRTHPERMARAKAAGFDTDNIHLHGTDEQKIFDEFRDGEGNYIYTSDIPELADYYASSRMFGSGRHIPVFTRLDNATTGETSAQGVSGEWRRFDPENKRDVKSIFNNFTPEDLESNKFAKGGYVEAKAGNYENPTPADIDALRTAYKNWLHDATLGSDETTKATLGAFLAKGSRPELFNDISLDDLIAAAKANQQYERQKLSEEHPVASGLGSLATLPLWMTLGGETTLGQATANAGAGAFNRYMDEENPLDKTSLAIEAGLPMALKYWKPLTKAAALSLPALAHSDNSLFNLENMAQDLP